MPAPVVTTLPATDVRVTRAVLNGEVNPEGLLASYWFELFPDLWQTMGWPSTTVPNIDSLPSGATFWLRAYDLQATLSEGDRVAGWKDAIGGVTLVPSSGENSRPYYSEVLGFPTVQFGKSEDWNSLYTATTGENPLKQSAEFTMFVVEKALGGLNVAASIWGDVDRVNVGYSSSRRKVTVKKAVGESAKALELNIATTDFKVQALTRSADDAKSYSDGTFKEALGEAMLGLHTNERFYVGRGQEVHKFYGHVPEVIVFNRALSDEEIAEVNAYLQAKYNSFAGPLAEPDYLPTAAQLESGQAVENEDGTYTLAVPTDLPPGKDGDAGEGEAAVPVSETAEGLEPGVTYRFRLHAENEA